MVTKISTRVVSATNKNLSSMIAENLFRSDLYYRLSVVDVRIPPLKNRKKDILPLAKYFIDMFSEKFSIPFETLSEEAEVWLLNHDWPGNIRELRNRVERSILTGTPPVITVQDVNPMETRDAQQENACYGSLYFPREGIDFTAFMDQMKNDYIKTALERAKGNEAKAARLLNLNHHTFRYHYKKIKDKE
jgi:transcriptional regulator with PAS, ATPase and Fis domain